MAELADAQDLGSCVYSCRFDPCYPHQQRSRWPSPSAPFLVRVIGREESHCVLGFACEMRSSRAQQNARAPKSTGKFAETAEGACAEFDPAHLPLLVRVIGREESHCVLGFACEMRSSRAQQNARAPKSRGKSAETAEGACAEFDPCYPHHAKRPRRGPFCILPSRQAMPSPFTQGEFFLPPRRYFCKTSLNIFTNRKTVGISRSRDDIPLFGLSLF